MSRRRSKDEGELRVLRIQCPCGRNLADVTNPGTNPRWTRDGLTVTERSGVDFVDFRPWSAAGERVSTGPAPTVNGMDVVDILRARRARSIAAARGDRELPPEPPPLPPPAPTRPKHPELQGKQYDWCDHTYSCRCRCGEKHSVRHERISTCWQDNMPKRLRVVVVVIGRDL